MLVLPPTNHFEKGRSHSRTLFHFSNQCRSEAMPAQKPSGSSSARFDKASYASRLGICALAEKAALGLKTRCSLRRDSILLFASDMGNHRQKERPQRRVAAVLDLDEARLLRLTEVLVVHRNVVLPLFRGLVFREDRGDWAS